MEDTAIDFDVFYDVIYKNSLSATREDQEKVLYGGPLNVDLSKVVGSLGELLLNGLRQHEPGKTAFVDASTGVSLSYRDLINGSLKVAAFLREIGIGRGDVVGLFSENRPEFPMVVFGCFYLGVAVNACNPTYTATEVEHVLQLTKPKVIFTTSESLKKILRVSKDGTCDFLRDIVSIESSSDARGKVWLLNDIFKNKKLKMGEDFTPPAVDLKETVGLIQMSSGTTGLLKAVVNTQHNMLTVMSISLQVKGSDPQIYKSTFVAVPFCHTYGIFTIINCALGGLTAVSLRKFSSVAFLKGIEQYKVEVLALVPSLWVFLTKSPLVDKYDLSSVKVVFSGAAALSKEVEEEMKRRFKGRGMLFIQGYGMTEATLSMIARKKDTVYKAGSVGSLYPGIYCKVVDPETGRLCGLNEPGELWFKGDTVMKGYLGNAKATREVVDEEGWLHSGDIGYYDEQRHFYIVDRLKELIKYKGFQVPPAELEDILLGHPQVMDAAVVGIPDPVSSEELPMAFIVKKPSAKGVTEKELIEYVASRVSEYKRLRGGVKFIAAIPRNPNGKILRRELRKYSGKPVAKL